MILSAGDAILNKLIDEAWLSLVERCVRDAEVAGSNPVASILIMEENTGVKFPVFSFVIQER